MTTHSPWASASPWAISLPPFSNTILAPGVARPATTARPSGPIRATSKLGTIAADWPAGDGRLGAADGAGGVAELAAAAFGFPAPGLKPWSRTGQSLQLPRP